MRHDHQMPVVVGVFVLDDEAGPAAMDDQRLGVDAPEGVAENAAVRARGPLRHIPEPPGSPQTIHEKNTVIKNWELGIKNFRALNS